MIAFFKLFLTKSAKNGKIVAKTIDKAAKKVYNILCIYVS